MPLITQVSNFLSKLTTSKELIVPWLVFEACTIRATGVILATTLPWPPLVQIQSLDQNCSLQYLKEKQPLSNFFSKPERGDPRQTREGSITQPLTAKTNPNQIHHF